MPRSFVYDSNLDIKILNCCALVPALKMCSFSPLFVIVMIMADKAATSKPKDKHKINSCHSKGDMDCKKVHRLSFSEILSASTFLVMDEMQAFVSCLDSKLSQSDVKQSASLPLLLKH